MARHCVSVKYDPPTRRLLDKDASFLIFVNNNYLIIFNLKKVNLKCFLDFIKVFEWIISSKVTTAEK